MTGPVFQDEAYHPSLSLIPLHKWDGRRDGKPLGKRPLETGWTKKRYGRTDISELVRRGHNYGLAIPDGILVIDVDPRNFPPGETLATENPWRRLCAGCGIDPSAYPTVVTGSGGLHVFMSIPRSLSKSEILADFPGIEFKTSGKQVVAAGSLHPDTGRAYGWDSIDDLSEPPPGAPKAVVDLISRRNSPLAPVQKPAEAVMDAEQLERLLDVLDPSDFPTNAEWEPLLMSLHDATGGDIACGRIFDVWCSAGIGYAGDVLNRWRSLDTARGHRRGIGTLVSLLEGKPDAMAVLSRAVQGDASADFDRVRSVMVNNGKAADTLENALAAIAETGIGPRFNELKQSVVFEAPAWDAGFGGEMTEHTLRLVRLLLHERFSMLSYRPAKESVHEAVMTLAYQNKFNPVTAYLDGLAWDGVSRIDGLFPVYFRTTDGDYERAVGRAFLVGAVARARRPGCKRDEMPVLKGRQGAGKSTGLRVLFGDAFFSDAELGDLRGKDAPIGLQGTWLHEFAEMDGLSRAESSTLKAFVSRAIDRYRPPYGRVLEEVPRRSVFAGTCNEGSFLQDGTGARRYWPLTVTGDVDVETIRRDRDQLWAEADAAFRAGDAWTLPTELWTVAAERQDDETAADPWADEIAAFLEYRQLDLDGDSPFSVKRAPLPADRVLTRELIGHLVKDRSRMTRVHERRIRSLMEGMGWEHSKSIRVPIDGVDCQGAGYRKVR